jgi:hypothetical protein
MAHAVRLYFRFPLSLRGSFNVSFPSTTRSPTYFMLPAPDISSAHHRELRAAALESWRQIARLMVKSHASLFENALRTTYESINHIG